MINDEFALGIVKDGYVVKIRMCSDSGMDRIVMTVNNESHPIDLSRELFAITLQAMNDFYSILPAERIRLREESRF